MPFLTRLKWAVACGAALGAVLVGGWCIHLTHANKALGAAVAGLQIDLDTEKNLRAAEHAVATRQATRLAALTTKQRETNAKLQDALRGSAAWAAEPVPAPVADALGLPVSAEAPAGNTAK